MPRKLSLIVLFILISVLFLVTFRSIAKKPSVYAGPDETSQWTSWATKAWNYFQPGVAVDPDTGLSHAGYGWPYFTEWDIGTYVLAILDAEKIGILPRDGLWGSTDRFNRIIAFLQTRELTPANVSYLWYDARDGTPASDISNRTTNVSDMGFLLTALHTLKTYRAEYATIIDDVIYNRENITKLASDPIAWTTTSGVYEWYVAHGFKFFGFDIYSPVQEALTNLKTTLEGPQLKTYNVTLPKTEITSEPLLLAAFTLPPEPGMLRLILKAYLAQQNRYYETGNFTGFSEGNTGLLGWPGYVYEWIVRENGATWKITPADITPIIYIKVGFGFYALFQTQYALDLINHVNATFTNYDYGYLDGVDENGRVVDTIIDRTNGIVLSSARYALEHPTPCLLEDFPDPFASQSGFLNVTFIIGDTNFHPPYGWQAYTLDLMGSLGVASKLGQFSSSGYSEGKMDTWVASWDNVSRTVNIEWDEMGNTNVISIGGPPVNMFAYYHEQFGATPFYQTRIDTVGWYIQSDLTGKNYTFQWGVTDYVLISICHDNNRTILVGWGITHRGTVAICQILQYFDSEYVDLLSGRAVIIKWVDQNGDTEVDLGDEITTVETWP